ncbi:MAG: hypothetical protein DMG17_31855 [Acidobacteria bacterium]|nr:MAG: hypothetical protein DMG17_31855 [Acidobacteriota bacterium]
MQKLRRCQYPDRCPAGTAPAVFLVAEKIVSVAKKLVPGTKKIVYIHRPCAAPEMLINPVKR